MVNYDPESNLVSIEIAVGKISHVIEVGNFLIHVNKNNAPLLLEILDAGRLVSKFKKMPEKEIIKSIVPAGTGQ